MESTEPDCSIELGNLCSEIIHSIFSRIPLKPLTRLKCVSRAWCNFINNFRRFNPPTTTSGLVILLNRIAKNNQASQESIFIEYQKEKGLQPDDGVVGRHSFRLHLIDSCNGLLLYASNDGQYWTYYVCNPFLDQCLALPGVHEVTRLACVSLAFDDESFHEKFMVVSFFLREIDFAKGSMGCKIFYSETWEWRILEARIFDIDLLLGQGFEKEQLFCPGLFCKGRLYWIWSLCMLVYDNRGEVFKLIPLPLKESGNKLSNPSHMLSQLQWESDGRIYFCYQLNESLCIFKLIRNNGGDFLCGEDHDYCMGSCSWQPNRSVSLTRSIFPKLEYRHGGNAVKLNAGCRVRPCAFNQDLQLLYLHVPPGRIVSYSLETEEFALVWCSEDLDGNSSYIQKVLPCSFKPVYLFRSLERNCSHLVAINHFFNRVYQ